MAERLRAMFLNHRHHHHHHHHRHHHHFVMPVYKNVFTSHSITKVMYTINKHQYMETVLNLVLEKVSRDDWSSLGPNVRSIPHHGIETSIMRIVTCDHLWNCEDVAMFSTRNTW